MSGSGAVSDTTKGLVLEWDEWKNAVTLRKESGPEGRAIQLSYEQAQRLLLMLNYMFGLHPYYAEGRR